MVVENGRFWSEIGSGFGGPGGTPTENSEEHPPPPPVSQQSCISIWVIHDRNCQYNTILNDVTAKRLSQKLRHSYKTLHSI